ncbi:MAG: hypothetical protein WKG07_42650 [Hymenobacter sp.]
MDGGVVRNFPVSEVKAMGAGCRHRQQRVGWGLHRNQPAQLPWTCCSRFLRLRTTRSSKRRKRCAACTSIIRWAITPAAALRPPSPSSRWGCGRAGPCTRS